MTKIRRWGVCEVRVLSSVISAFMSMINVSISQTLMLDYTKYIIPQITCLHGPNWPTQLFWARNYNAFLKLSKT